MSLGNVILIRYGYGLIFREYQVALVWPWPFVSKDEFSEPFLTIYLTWMALSLLELFPCMISIPLAMAKLCTRWFAYDSGFRMLPVAFDGWTRAKHVVSSGIPKILWNQTRKKSRCPIDAYAYHLWNILRLPTKSSKDFPIALGSYFRMFFPKLSSQYISQHSIGCLPPARFEGWQIPGAPCQDDRLWSPDTQYQPVVPLDHFPEAKNFERLLEQFGFEREVTHRILSFQTALA